MLFVRVLTGRAQGTHAASLVSPKNRVLGVQHILCGMT